VINAVYFDLDDTLYDQLQPFRLACKSTDLIKYLNERLSIEDLYKCIRRHSDRLWMKHICGQMTLEELRIERTVAAFADFGIKLPGESAVVLHHLISQSNWSMWETHGITILSHHTGQAGFPFG